jgi:hypothetical protein
VAAQSNTQYAGQLGNPVQNVPGTIYNSESNLVVPVPGNAQAAGLADYGTRLKATFNNIPAGVTLWVSTANVNNAAVPVTPPTPIGGSAGNVGTTTYVQLVTSETVSDGNLSGFFPNVPYNGDTPSTGNTPIVQIPVAANGTAQAVWEVVNTNPATIDSFKVAVYLSYTANVAQNSPPAGSATVNLSFAPTPTAAFTASAGARLPARSQFRDSSPTRVRRAISSRSVSAVRSCCIRTSPTRLDMTRVLRSRTRPAIT